MSIYSRRTNLAWSAGFIDGEGCFQIAIRRHPWLFYHPIISAAQAGNFEPIESLQAILGGDIVCQRALTATGKKVYRWSVSSYYLCLEVSKLIIPYLIAKERQARLMIDFCLIAMNQSNGQCLSQEHIDYRESKRQELQRMKVA